MTSLKQMLDALEPVAGTPAWRGAIPEEWLQGRTAYGGLSTALALHCAMRSEDDLPPLRSAQVSFVGPLAGPVTVTTHRLRRGKNAAFVQADVASEAGLGLRCTFVFMRPLDSIVTHRVDRTPAFPCPQPGDKTYFGNAQVPFTRNFEFLDRRQGDDLGAAEWLRWVRLNEREGLHPMVELAAIGDCLPPAALRLLGKPAPLSSLTWLMNVLASAPETQGGWWLLRASTDHAVAGSSSQTMAIWNAAGACVAEQMQSVAIFG